MGFTSSIVEISIGLFLCMLAFLELGRRIGKKNLARDQEGFQKGVGPIEAAIFAVLGLLIAFTFSGAAGRLDTRRQLIAEEANAVGTAYLRLLLLPQEARQKLQEDFRTYLSIRLNLTRNLSDKGVYRSEIGKMVKLQNEIWSQAVSACRDLDSPPTTMLLLPALNQMIDITTTRTMLAEMHPPGIIFAMLCLLAIVSSLVAGYGMAGQKERSWIHMAGFCAIISLTVYVIFDLEYPRFGLIQIDHADKVLLELQRSFGN